MKKLIPGMLVLLILICSCNAKKSFTHQRYTHFKNKKTTTAVAENKTRPVKEAKTAAVTAEVPAAVVTENAVVSQTETKPAKSSLRADGYTRSVINKVIIPVVNTGREKAVNLVTSNSKTPVTVTKIKPIKVDQSSQKRGLLWGVIDGILAICLIVAFVALIVWLLLVLT